MVSFDRLTFAFIVHLMIQGSVLPGHEMHGGSAKCEAPNRNPTRSQTAESAVPQNSAPDQGSG
jgi:hypothetical protein